jgi:Tectonin domain
MEPRAGAANVPAARVADSFRRARKAEGNDALGPPSLGGFFVVDTGARPASRVLVLLAAMALAVPLAGPSAAAAVPGATRRPGTGTLAATVSVAPDTLAEGEQVTVTGSDFAPGAQVAVCQRAAGAAACQPGSKTVEVAGDGTFSTILPARAYSDAATCSTPGACVILVADPADAAPTGSPAASASLTVNPTPAKWWRLRGTASEVDVGANGSAWMVGRSLVPGGHEIARFDGQQWIVADGGAEHVAVDPAGQPWIVTDAGVVFQRMPTGEWQERPGVAAADIDVGADGTVWVTGREVVPGGHGLHRWTGSDWTTEPGGAERLAVDPTGQPWIVASNGGIYQRTTTGWQRRPGIGRDIDVGADRSVWVVGTNVVTGGFGVYEWTGTIWRGVSGGADRIASDPAGQAWVVNVPGEVYRRLRSSEETPRSSVRTGGATPGPNDARPERRPTRVTPDPSDARPE